MKANAYNHWWDDDLEDAKAKSSVQAHREWTNMGKPKSGYFFSTMHEKRNAYRRLIRSKEKLGKDMFSNELNEICLAKIIIFLEIMEVKVSLGKDSKSCQW